MPIEKSQSLEITISSTSMHAPMLPMPTVEYSNRAFQPISCSAWSSRLESFSVSVFVIAIHKTECHGTEIEQCHVRIVRPLLMCNLVLFIFLNKHRSWSVTHHSHRSARSEHDKNQTWLCSLELLFPDQAAQRTEKVENAQISRWIYEWIKPVSLFVIQAHCWV